jgi:hypothetical protein
MKTLVGLQHFWRLEQNRRILLKLVSSDISNSWLWSIQPPVTREIKPGENVLRLPCNSSA